jgi:hypothetical protein
VCVCVCVCVCPFVSLCIGMSSHRVPATARQSQSAYRAGPRSKSDHSVLKRARVALRALGPFAVRELAENADALIAPLRMGAVSFAERHDLCEGSAEDIFSSPNRTSVGSRFAARRVHGYHVFTL